MHLRRLRQAQSLTLAQLADQVGVTASALSQIERGSSEPTLGTLWRLGRALNASLFDFFAGQEAPTVDVTRAGDRTVVEFERFRYEVMARSAQRGIDLFTLRLEPGAGPVRDPVSHAGEEAGMVVEGTMDVVVAGASYRLGPGDAIWFVSGQPHTFAAVGDEPCLSVWADTIPDHAEPGGSRSVFDGLIAGTGAPGDARTMLAPGAARRPARDRARPRHRRRPPARRGRAAGRDRLQPAGVPRDRARPRTARPRRTSRTSCGRSGWRTSRSRRCRSTAGASRARGWSRTAAARSRAPSLGGAPPTPPGGIRARVVDAGGWRRRDLDRLDVRGALVLIDWRKGPGAPTDAGLELGLRGAAGVIVTPAKGGPYFQAEGALGGFDGHWHAGAPPMMTIRMRDGDALRARLAEGPVEATMTVNAAIAPGDRRQQRRRLPAGRRAGPDRRRRPPRRLVPRGVRQRHRGRRPARHRPRAGAGRPPPAPPDLLHLAHRRGVGAAGPHVRLVHGRVAPGEPRRTPNGARRPRSTSASRRAGTRTCGWRSRRRSS